VSYARRLIVVEDGWFRLNPTFAAVVYRNVVDADARDCAGAFEALFRLNGWNIEWRGRISKAPHYHSSTYEIIGIAEGSTILALGSAGGRRIAMDAGDALLVPPGLEHRQVGGETGGIYAVGAVPTGSVWDICSELPSHEERQQIAALTRPDRDPVTGEWA
jgi:uncharacterized protein YjlB